MGWREVDDARRRFDEARDALLEAGPCSEPLHTGLIKDDAPDLISRIDELEEAIAAFLEVKPGADPQSCPYCGVGLVGKASHKPGCALDQLRSMIAD